MTYQVIHDFRGGVDRRRDRSNGTPGTLWVVSNGHLTKGGEIEKRKKFVRKYDLYAGHTFGMKAAGSTLYVFGYEDQSTFPVGAIPTGVTYMRLVHPTTPSTPIAKILDAIAFLGQVYVIVQFADTSIHHYWAGSRVAAWDGGAGLPAAKGTFGIAFGTKIYIAAGSVVYFCAINDPTTWTSGTNGAGFFNVVSSGRGSEDLVSMMEFNGQLAFLASSYAQVWAIDADPTKNVFKTNVDNTGSVAKRGAVNYGNVDGYFLSQTGVRSLRQQNITGLARAEDVGDNIEDMIQNDLATLPAATIAATQAAINPIDGRLWYWIGERIYVYSPYSSSDVSAWSWYDMAGLPPGNIDIYSRRMHLRSGDSIYVYGGDSGIEYDVDASDIYYCDVEFPFLVADRIADQKIVTGYDFSLQGEWQVWMKTDPNNVDIEVEIGTASGTTYGRPNYDAALESTHFAPRLRSTSPGAAKIANFTLTFEKAEY
mgnify:CR=1 FL=1